MTGTDGALMTRQAAPADTTGHRQVRETVEPDEFREVMSSICTPVAIVSALLGERPHATTVSAFLSLSMSPPMVLISLDRSSDLLACLRTTRRFGINLLAQSQGPMATRFSRKGGDRFGEAAWQLRDGLPYLVGSAGWVACSVERFVPGGDHLLVLGGVDAASSEPAPPLTYHRRSYGTHAPLTVATGAVVGDRR